MLLRDSIHGSDVWPQSFAEPIRVYFTSTYEQNNVGLCYKLGAASLNTFFQRPLTAKKAYLKDIAKQEVRKNTDNNTGSST